MGEALNGRPATLLGAEKGLSVGPQMAKVFSICYELFTFLEYLKGILF